MLQQKGQDIRYSKSHHAGMARSCLQLGWLGDSLDDVREHYSIVCGLRFDLVYVLVFSHKEEPFSSLVYTDTHTGK